METVSRVSCSWLLASLLGSAVAVAQNVSVRGRLVDETGAPLQGVVHVLGDELVDCSAFLENPQSRTELGRFELTVAPRSRIHVIAGGRIASVLEHPTLAGGLAGTADLGDVPLARGVTLVGRVRDTDGEPLANVHVYASLAARGPRAWSDVGREPVTGAFTGEDGRFRLIGAPPAGMQVVFFKPGYYLRVVSPVGQTTPLDVRLERSGFVSGRVLDSDGRPVEVTVSARYEASRVDFAHANYTRRSSASDGTFRLPIVRRGRYRLTGFRPGLLPAPKSAILQGPAQGIEVTPLRLPATADLLEIRAVDAATREPVDEFRAAVDWNRRHGGIALEVVRFASMARPATGGKVELPVNPRRRPDRGAIQVRAPGYGHVVTQAPTDVSKPFVVELPAECRITGVIRDDRGAPVAGARVWAIPMFDARKTWTGGGPPLDAARSAEDGSYSIGQLAPGMQIVQAMHPDYVIPRSHNVEVEADNSSELEIELTKGHAVTVAIDGPLRGLGWVADLAWHELPREAPDQNLFFGSQNLPRSEPLRDGLQFGLLRAAEYRLRLSRTSQTWLGYPLMFELEPFRAGEDSKVTVAAADVETGTVEGRVTTDGVPFERLVVYAVPTRPGERRLSFFSFVDSSGQFEIEVLPGEHRLQIADLASLLVIWEHDEPVAIEASSRRKIDLSLEAQRLRLELVPRGDNTEVIGYEITLKRTETTQRRFGPSGTQHNVAYVRPEPRAAKFELLVPTEALEVTVYHNADELRPSGGSAPTEVGSATVEVPSGETRELRVVVDAPRTNAQIEAGK